MQSRYSEDSDEESTAPASPVASIHTGSSGPGSPPRSHGSARNLTKGLVEAITSPVKAAVNSPIPESVQRIGRGLKKRWSKKTLLLRGGDRSQHEPTWQEELELPPGTTRDQAMAILLCRELKEMDI